MPVRPALCLSALVLLAPLGACTAADQAPAEAKPVGLFNGKDLAGWHVDVPEADDNPGIAPSFVVKDGLLVSKGEPQGHLITDAKYQNYRLVVEWRWPGKPGNCGVLVHASKPRALYGMFPQSIECQLQHGMAGDFWCIQENIGVPDMAKRRAGDPKTWGGGPKDSRNIKNLGNFENKLGEWNQMVIDCVGDKVTIQVNGRLANDGFGSTVTQGRIALQAEGAECEFRKVELTPLPAPAAK